MVLLIPSAGPADELGDLARIQLHIRSSSYDAALHISAISDPE